MKHTISDYVLDLRTNYNQITGRNVDTITRRRVDYEEQQWKELEESLDFAKPRKRWFRK